MGIKKTLLKYNPINRLRQKRIRKELKSNITILASNCLGGLLYHDYGQQFLSPTVNTRFDSPDFIKFVCNIDYYLSLQLNFIESQEPFPVAMLGDVKIYFVHYHTNEEAASKWYERIKRIDWNRIFIITNDNDGVTEEMITQLENSRFKNIIVFTSKVMPTYKCCFHLKRYKGEKEVGNTMKKSLFTGKMAAQSEFDFTTWFNKNNSDCLEDYRL